MSPPRADRSRSPGASRSGPPPARAERGPGRAFLAFLSGRERPAAALLLALHLALVLWGAARSSVTFDENYHLPSGVLIAARGDIHVSPVNPPLVKALCALPPLALGARLPDSAAVASRSQLAVGESFMRQNAARYQALFFSARVVAALISVALAILVWRIARRFYGPPAGLLALAFYALAPEALAHGGLVTLDVATALGLLATIYASWRFARSGRPADWLLAALACGLAFLTRFTAALLIPTLALLGVLWTLTRTARRPARLWTGLALLAPTTLLILNLGYLGHTSFTPLGCFPDLMSHELQTLRDRAPGLRLPLPDDYIAGLDRQMFESQPGFTSTYLLGRDRTDRVWYYFPLALLFKWPLGFLAALLVRLALRARSRPRGRRLAREATLIVPIVLWLAASMFGARLNVGVRYVFPILPPLCIWLAGLAAFPARIGLPARTTLARWALAGWLLAGAQAVESVAAAPWYLSFFNRLAGGPGGGDRLVNDSNVDWGQGLIALKEEMERRGIRRIHLAYHGTADPAIYGIDYVPYLGGEPGPESDWLAVSSYYWVGLTQRMMTPQGRTDWVTLDFRGLWTMPWVAHPAGCMYLFHFRQSAAPR